MGLWAEHEAAGGAAAAAEAVDGVADPTGVEQELRFLPVAPSTEGLTAPHLRDGYVVLEIPKSEVHVAGNDYASNDPSQGCKFAG